jgi:hypothetical protein
MKKVAAFCERTGHTVRQATLRSTQTLSNRNAAILGVSSHDGEYPTKDS